MRFLLAVLLVGSIYCLNPTEGKGKGGGGEVVGALIELGATLLTDGDSQSSTWTLPNGKKVDGSNCWQDGSGPCPNGNCLDEGRQGLVIKETTVGCKWFCFHRAHCKTQICCKSA